MTTLMLKFNWDYNLSEEFCQCDLLDHQFESHGVWFSGFQMY